VSLETTNRRWRPQHWRHIAASWDRTAAPWRQERWLEQASRDLPVGETVGVPVRGLFLLMLLFAVVIGPVNLYVLARKQCRIWMLWTVPLISVATSAGVVGYMFWTEGWHGHVRAEGLTVLDETSGRAATVGCIGFYTPLTPADGLHFAADTELTPIPRQDAQFGDRRPSRTLDWSTEQHLASGWLTARVPAYLRLRKSEARPERLTVRRGKDGALSAVNGLGAGIRQLWLADGRGRIHTARAPIPAGQEAALSPSGGAVARPLNLEGLRQAYRSDWFKHYQELTATPQNYLLPGCYIAVLDAAPFIEEGLRNAQTRAGRSVVYGIMKEPPDAH
jgi:hypothetical protein